eukprot:Gb_24601 [translate_table: standard]
MATLKRSGISFRRQGSSGLAWAENWIPAEIDGGAGGRAAPGPTITTTAHKQFSPLTHEVDQKSSSAIPPLKHSRSVGLIGAGYTRSRDHRIQNSASIDDLEPTPTRSGATGHKSKSRFLRWIKRTFTKFTAG